MSLVLVLWSVNFAVILLAVRLKWRKVDVIGQFVLLVIFGRSINFICGVVVEIWHGILFQRSEPAFQKLSSIGLQHCTLKR